MSPMARARAFIARWWPPAAIVAAAVLAQAIWSRAYDVPGGHAQEHVSSAGFVFGAVAAGLVIAWSVEGRLRRGPVLWVLVGAIVAAGIGTANGNIRVVDIIGPETWSNEQALELGPQRPGFEHSHDIARVADVLLSIAVGVLAGYLWRARQIPAWAGVATIGLAALLPAAHITSRVALLALTAGALAGRRSRRAPDVAVVDGASGAVA